MLTKKISLQVKLFVATLLFSTAITICLSLVELYNVQEKEATKIESVFKQIEETQVPLLSQALWVYNWDTVGTIVSSMASSHLISYIEVCDFEKEQCLRKGDIDQSPFLLFEVPITHTDLGDKVAVGSLKVQRYHGNWWDHIIQEFPAFLFFNGLQVFAVALAVFFLFSSMVTKRLMKVVKHTNAIDLTDITSIENLNVLKHSWSDDEIDTLAVAINGLTDKISDEFGRRVESEKQLNQTHKMEALGTLAGGIAHDFNNILAAIMGYTELCMLKHGNDSESSEWFENILSASTRAKDLISQILVFSRYSDDDFDTVNFSATVNEALQLLQPSIPSKVTLDQCLEEDVFVRGNGNQLHQIVMNLVSNAWAAMPDGGHLTVKLSTVAGKDILNKCRELGANSCAHLSVSDTGGGILTENLQSIFDPFFTTKDVGKGTGMGLAVVHGIVNKHGGQIEVESVLNEGSNFTVHLPTTASPAIVSATAKERLPEGHERLLVVDDEKMILEMADRILNSLGYEVTTVSDPKLAGALVTDASPPFDLMITDMSMPELQGDELARSIRQLAPQLNIMMWTGYSDSLESDQLRSMGINNIIPKPFSRAELALAVRKAIDS